LLVGTKGSDVYVLNVKDSSFVNAKIVVQGHSFGHLWALAIYKSKNKIK
jgi:hypothetical protein